MTRPELIQRAPAAWQSIDGAPQDETVFLAALWHNDVPKPRWEYALLWWSEGRLRFYDNETGWDTSEYTHFKLIDAPSPTPPAPEQCERSAATPKPVAWIVRYNRLPNSDVVKFFENEREASDFDTGLIQAGWTDSKVVALYEAATPSPATGERDAVMEDEGPALVRELLTTLEEIVRASVLFGDHEHIKDQGSLFDRANSYIERRLATGARG